MTIRIRKISINSTTDGCPSAK